jgi:hypothetical protein
MDVPFVLHSANLGGKIINVVLNGMDEFQWAYWWFEETDDKGIVFLLSFIREGEYVPPLCGGGWIEVLDKLTLWQGWFGLLNNESVKYGCMDGYCIWLCCYWKWFRGHCPDWTSLGVISKFIEGKKDEIILSLIWPLPSQKTKRNVGPGFNTDGKNDTVNH